MYRQHNTYPTGEKIVKGIRAESNGIFGSDIKAEDFKLYLANVLDPTNEEELEVKVIDDNPYWWTEPFTIWFTGEYILHWVNDDADINYKQTFTVSDRIDDTITLPKGKLLG
jgi:hypothetical protein